MNFTFVSSRLKITSNHTYAEKSDLRKDSAPIQRARLDVSSRVCQCPHEFFSANYMSRNQHFQGLVLRWMLLFTIQYNAHAADSITMNHKSLKICLQCYRPKSNWASSLTLHIGRTNFMSQKQSSLNQSQTSSNFANT